MSAAAPKLGIQNIGQISIIVHDLPRATAFYRDTLGLPLLFTAGNMAFLRLRGRAPDAGPRQFAGARSPKLHPLFPCSGYQRGAQAAHGNGREDRSSAAPDRPNEN